MTYFILFILDLFNNFFSENWNVHEIMLEILMQLDRPHENKIGRRKSAI